MESSQYFVIVIKKPFSLCSGKSIPHTDGRTDGQMSDGRKYMYVPTMRRYFPILASSSSNDEVVYNKFTISPFWPRAHQMTRWFAISSLFRHFASSSFNDEVVYNKFTISPFWPRAHPRTRWFTISSIFRHFGLDLTLGRGGLQ